MVFILLRGFGQEIAERRLTTSSSATAERGAVAAKAGRITAYKLQRKVARNEGFPT